MGKQVQLRKSWPEVQVAIPAFFTLAPVQCEEVANDLTTEEQRLMIDEVEGLMQTLAWKLGYLDARFGNGCGDQGHKSAVKSANKYRHAVRKAMGYHHRSDINV